MKIGETKVWVNMPFLIQWERIGFLEDTLKALSNWQVDFMRIIIFINAEDVDGLLTDMIAPFNKDITIEQIDVTENPLLLQWGHKKYIPDFLESDYTHFIYTDGDIGINEFVFKYWLKTKKLLDRNGYNKFIPGTFRIETYQGVDYASDLTYRTDIDSLPTVKVRDKTFFIPQEPFQGISIMDKDMAKEHLNSEYYSPMMDQSMYKFGFGETCISGYILHNVPEGYNHRILLPLDDYKRSWVYHLPSNYAANPDSEHGKIVADYVYKRIWRKLK